MTIDLFMHMIVDNALELVILDDEKFNKYEYFVVDDNSHEKPLVNEHETRVRKGKNKQAPKYWFLFHGLLLLFHEH